MVCQQHPRKKVWIITIWRPEERFPQNYISLLTHKRERGWSLLVVWRCSLWESAISTDVSSPDPEQSCCSVLTTTQATLSVQQSCSPRYLQVIIMVLQPPMLQSELSTLSKSKSLRKAMKLFFYWKWNHWNVPYPTQRDSPIVPLNRGACMLCFPCS